MAVAWSEAVLAELCVAVRAGFRTASGRGALLTEVVFALPGVGRLTYQALATLDLPLIMATVMYAAVFVIIANALVDGLYALLDPRIREGRHGR